MVPNDPFPGYMPPPLDGIWATAPYPPQRLGAHGRARAEQPRTPAATGSASTSTARNFDEDALGWPWDARRTRRRRTLPEAERKLIYDTTFWSQSNAGHTFGDHLTDAERRAVIEYLKTL